MRVLLLILICLAGLAGCKIEHRHEHQHHYDKLLPKNQPANPPTRKAPPRWPKLFPIPSEDDFSA